MCANELLYFPGALSIKTTARLQIDAGLIRIKNVQPGDGGEFVCEASNSIGKVSKTSQLILTGRNYKFHALSSEIILKIHSQLHS